MTLRFDDQDRTLTLSVRDLVEAGPASGHLVLEVAQRRRTRLAAGRAVHAQEQTARGEASDAYRAEVTVTHTFVVGEWTVCLQGRVDGLVQEAGRTIVEEIKSTALDAGRLAPTRAADWPAYTAQLELYLWMLHAGGWPDPTGRLVLISLLDGFRHVIGVPLDAARLGAYVRARAERLVDERDRLLRRYALRRGLDVPTPFGAWRPGQAAISDAARDALGAGQRLLVEAPTGLGKTAAVLHGALTWAFGHDKHLFWATSRNTQQAGVIATLERFRARGLDLTWVALRAKEKVCLNDVVACRPDTCRFARDYYDKRESAGVLETIAARGALTPDDAMDLGRAHELCPFQLGLDAGAQADVVVGDVNYAASPSGRLGALFGEGRAGDRVVIVDEAHQLVDRAREHRSPRVEARLARRAAQELDTADPDAFAPFVALAEEIERAVLDVVDRTPGPWRDEQAEAELPLAPLRRLADRVDALALDYALLRATRGLGAEVDPWIELARQLLRFVDVAEEADAETVALAVRARGAEAVRLLCLDPSRTLGPKLAELGGLIGCSATLAPREYHVDLLGLPADTRWLSVPSPFPPERRAIVVAPRVSTAWRDRLQHAPATAALLEDLVAAIPGNAALYFPSFAMLDDLVDRLHLQGRRLLRQRPGMDDDERARWLLQLAEPEPTVLAAVLGGVFAEGIDLPPGALSAVVIVGPALPPVGLERDLLRQWLDQRFEGQGFRYASLVPGMTRVVQAAGRLVRRPEDRGVIVLVGRRFRWRDHAALLPPDWAPRVPDDPAVEVAATFAAWGAGRAAAPAVSANPIELEVRPATPDAT